MTRFATILADPPWDYGRDGARWPTGPPTRAATEIQRAAFPYKTASLGAIASLPVAEWAAPDSRLWLWATNRHLPAALAVLTAWGFTYRQTLIWRKTGNPSPFGGSVAPNHAEFLLVGTRGNPPGDGRLESSVIDHPKLREHSRKPEMFVDLIESVSPPPRLEMFARRARLGGWEYWGDEALPTAELPEPEMVGGGLSVDR